MFKIWRKIKNNELKQVATDLAFFSADEENMTEFISLIEKELERNLTDEELYKIWREIHLFISLVTIYSIENFTIGQKKRDEFFSEYRKQIGKIQQKFEDLTKNLPDVDLQTRIKLRKKHFKFLKNKKRITSAKLKDLWSEVAHSIIIALFPELKFSNELIGELCKSTTKLYENVRNRIDANMELFTKE